MIIDFLPNTPRLKNIVPIWVISDNQAALRRNEITLNLHEFEIEFWKVGNFWFLVRVTSQDAHLANGILPH